MHIKRLSARGFKTYKDQITVEFDPKYNAIVGLNGSGKSNLLSAIEFVMTDKIGVGRERATYLHEGASAAVLNAWVEIVLDNKDRRIRVIDKDEVTIRRRFGTMKDEFLLDGKHVSNQELNGVLESCGFSRTNPYHVVRQGKVTELTAMSDNSRLKLLKEIAGTRVYDERRKEALQTLEETGHREIEVDRTLAMTNKRVEDLKEEHAELLDYQKHELRKRWIEYLILENEWNGICNNIKQLESRYDEQMKFWDECNVGLATSHEERERLETELKTCKTEAQSLAKQLKEIRKIELQTHEDFTRAELELKACISGSEAASSQRLKKELKLKGLRGEIEAAKDLIKTALRPDVKTAEAAYQDNVSRDAKVKDEMAQLKAKMNRARQFKSIKERNVALKSESTKIESRIHKLDAEADKAANELNNLTSRSQSSESYNKLLAEQNALKEKKDHIAILLKTSMDEAEDLDRRQSGIQEQLRDSHSEIDRMRRAAENFIRDVERTMRDSQVKANRAAMKWARENGCESLVFGSLLENIRVQPEFFAAVEVAAGSQLFNLLVHNHTTAASVIGHIKENRLGGTTITPLSDLRQNVITYPTADVLGDTAAPLVDYIRCSDAIRPAVTQVFGKFLIVKDADTGNKLQVYGFDCITQEGDKVTRKGILSGGCRANLTRMKSFGEYLVASERLKKAEEEQTQMQTALNEALQARQSARLETDKYHKELSQIGNRQSGLVDALHRVENEGRRKDAEKDTLESRVKDVQRESEIMKETLQRNRREVLTHTLGDLSAEESQRLSEAQKEAAELLKSEAQLQVKLKRSQKALGAAVNNLEKILLPSAQTLEEELCCKDNVDDVTTEERKIELERRCRSFLNEKQTVTTLRENTTSKMKVALTNVEQLSREVELQSQKEQKLSCSVSSIDAKVRSTRWKLQDSIKRRDEIEEKRHRPAEANCDKERLESLDESGLLRDLTKVQKKLSSFPNVNKKAADQFTSFIDEQEKLMRNRERLTNASKSIYELIDSLDQQKDSTLLNTFENVNKNFSKVFSQLVPGGRAKMILKKLSPADIQKLEDQKRKSLSQPEGSQVDNVGGEVLMVGPPAPELGVTDENAGDGGNQNRDGVKQGTIVAKEKQKGLGKVEMYTGVGIKASFTGQEKTYHTLQQLSGGQKTILALALIFGIQHCDPAPFYLFDEVDAALDDQYRGAVAALMSRNTTESQYILTSFRRQLAEVADAFFNVTSFNRCSSLAKVSKEVALNVIEELTRGQEEPNWNMN